MGKIMELFGSELSLLNVEVENDGWNLNFRGETYPPRIVLDQVQPPLFDMTPDGQKETRPACIQIIGRPDVQVVTTGKLQISKKDLNKMVNRATEVLNLYLHGFMQEHKEMENANAD